MGVEITHYGPEDEESIGKVIDHSRQEEEGKEDRGSIGRRSESELEIRMPVRKKKRGEDLPPSLRKVPKKKAPKPELPN